MADPAPSVAVAAGSLIVTASAPVLTAAENDLFCARGQAVPIASRQSPTQITLKQPWPIAALTGEQAFSILSLGEYWRSSISINKRFVDLLSKWEIVSPFKFDAAGALADRANYNNQPKGFVYVATDQAPIQIYIKLANTNSSSDWSFPIYLGSGGQVEWQAALDQERAQRTQADSALSGAITQEVSDRRVAVSGEQLRAQGVESVLKNRLDTYDTYNLDPRVTGVEGNISLLGSRVGVIEGFDVGTRLPKVEKAAAPVTVAFMEPLFWDLNGILGTAQTLHVPRAIYVRQGGEVANIIDGTTDTSPIPGYFAFNFSSTQPQIGALYFNLDRPGGKLLSAVLGDANIPNANLTGRAQVLASVLNGRVQTHLKVVNLDGDFASRVLPTVDPWVYDGGKLLYPSLYLSSPSVFQGFNLFQSVGPGGTVFAYREVDVVSGDAEEVRVYFDFDAAAAGQVPVKAARGLSMPLIGDFKRVMLAYAMGGKVRPAAGQAIVSADTGGFARNQFSYAKDLSALDPRRLWQNGTANATTVVSVTDPIMTAMGITQGIAAPQGQQVYVSCDLTGARSGDLGFVRLYVISDSDDGFGPSDGVRVYVQTDDGSIPGIGVLRPEKRLSARVWSFIWTGTLPASTSTIRSLNVGMEGISGHTMIVAGVQVACGPGCRWIARNDFPGRISACAAEARMPTLMADTLPDQLVMGPDLWTIAGRPLAIYPANCLPDKVEGVTLEFTLSSVRADLANQAYVRSGRQQLVISPSELGGIADISVRALLAPNLRYVASCTVNRAPASMTGAYTLTLIGDSITNRGAAQNTKDKTDAIGLAASFVGTLNGQDATGANNGPLGEGREGWKFADYVYMDTRFPPVPVGQEAAYRSGSLGERNPFIRAATGGDPAARVYNGYIFDYGFYLTRFGFAVPTHVIILLGMNDVILTPATAVAQVQAGLAAIVPSIMAAAPSASIAIGSYPRPRSTLGDSDARLRNAVITAQLDYARTLNASLGRKALDFINLHAHVSGEVGYGQTGVGLNAKTGLATFAISDSVHPVGVGRYQVAAQLAAWIACKIAGTNDLSVPDCLPLSGGRVTGVLTAAAGVTTPLVKMGQTIGGGGASHIRLYDQGTDNASYGLGIAGGSLVLNTGGGRVSFRNAGSEVGSVDAGGAMVLSAPVLPGRYTVATLPTPGQAGRVAYATNGRASNGAGAFEAAGAGTGCAVTDSGSAWRVAGTNQTVQA